MTSLSGMAKPGGKLSEEVVKHPWTVRCVTVTDCLREKSNAYSSNNSDASSLFRRARSELIHAYPSLKMSHAYTPRVSFCYCIQTDPYKILFPKKQRLSKYMHFPNVLNLTLIIRIACNCWWWSASPIHEYVQGRRRRC